MERLLINIEFIAKSFYAKLSEMILKTYDLTQVEGCSHKNFILEETKAIMATTSPLQRHKPSGCIRTFCFLKSKFVGL
jgi:hypothetical protein